MNRVVRAHLFLFLSTIIASLNYSIAKMVTPVHLSPAVVIGSRMVCTSLFFYLFIVLTGRSFYIEKGDRFRLIASAVFGIAINQICFFEGLSRTLPINASLIMSGIPITVFLLSIFFLKENISISRIIGLGLSAIGAALLLLHSKGKPNGIFLGDLLVLSNSISYGIFMIVVRDIMKKYDSIVVLFWLFLIGMFLASPYLYYNINSNDWHPIPSEAWMALLYVIIMATIVNYYIGIDVLKDISPSTSSIYVYVQPLTTMIIAISLGKDHLELERTLAAVAIIAGVYLVSKKKIEA
ncbi:MAG: DMT family transporter [Cytophagaceae bacterium]|jgi:drug/metabolite transporter (DMT)-like permease|nr:DMT family transporter [Cytophagaceae bacterium]